MAIAFETCSGGYLPNFWLYGSFCVSALSGSLAWGTMFDDFSDSLWLEVSLRSVMLSQKLPISL